MKKIGNVYILGDSYSTFRGYIPETHAPYYKPIVQECTDVTDVNQTWWKIILDNTESNLILNDSWSGTTICHTGYDGNDCSNRSFVTRFGKLADENYFADKDIDTVFLFGATNDNWANSPLGEPKHSNWTDKDLYNVLPAIWCLYDKVHATLPNSRIITILNTDFKPEIRNEILKAAEHYGFEHLELKDISKDCGHPNIEGMSQIAKQVLEIL